MDLRTAEIIASANHDLELRREYAGRGMYGRSTAGIIGSHADFFSAIGQILLSFDEDDQENVGEFFLYESLQTDNMGFY